MSDTYRAIMLTKKGGPDVLEVVELPVENPGPGQLRVRVRAAGVGSTDLSMLAGPLDHLLRKLEPNGVDFVFDAVGGANITSCIGALHPGGTVVGFGFMEAAGMLSNVAMFVNLFVGARLRGRRAPFTASPRYIVRTSSHSMRICPRSLR